MPDPTPSTSPPEPPEATTLRDWLERGGARADALRIERYADGERGVHAARDIAAGETVVFVPDALMLTVEMARDADTGRRVTASGAPADAGTHLTVFLMEAARTAGSKWQPYLATLPRSLDHFGVCFDARDLAYLEGTRTLEVIRARRQHLEREHATLRDRVGAALVGSSEDFVRARSTVDSRLFGVTVGGRATQAMVPLADMLNHAPRPELTWSHDAAAGGFVARALDDLVAGTPLRCSYGLKSNARLLVTYGFTLPDNPEDEAGVRVPLRDGLELHARRLGGERIGDALVLAAPAHYRADATRRLFAFARLAAAGDAALAPGAEDRPSSLALERAAMAIVADGCARGLSRFATSIADDDALLAGDALVGNARNAVQARRGEQRALHALRTFALETVGLLDAPRVLARRALAGRYDARGPFNPYLRETAMRLAVPALTRK